jgi:acyl carrier protein
MGRSYSTGIEEHYALLSDVADRDRLVQELASLLSLHLKLRTPGSDIGPDEPIFGGRLQLDSVDAAQWVVTVERHFGLRIPDEELVGDGLRSLGALADVLIQAGKKAD